MAVESTDRFRPELCRRCKSAFFTYTGLNMHICRTHLKREYNPLDPPANARNLVITEWP